MSLSINGSSHISRSQYIQRISTELDASIDTSNKIIELLRSRQGGSLPKSERVFSPDNRPEKSAFSRFNRPSNSLASPQGSRVKWGSRTVYSPSGGTTNGSLSPLPSSPSFIPHRKRPEKRKNNSSGFFRPLPSSEK